MALAPRYQKVIRDLWDNKARTVLVVLAIAVGVFTFGSVFTTSNVLLTDMDDQYLAINPPSITFNIDGFDQSLINWVERQPLVTDANARTRTTLKLVKPDRKETMFITGYRDFSDIQINTLNPQTGTWPPGRKEIAIERSSLFMSGAQIGDQITVELPNGLERQLTVTGTVYDVTSIPANLFPNVSGYVTQETLSWLGLDNGYNQLLITTDPTINNDLAALETLSDDLQQDLKNRSVIVSNAEVVKPIEHWGAEITQAFVYILLGIGIFSLILSGFLVINTISAILTQQRQQIGMMKAVGATNPQVSGIYLIMVALYGIIALIVAIPITLILAYGFLSAIAGFLNLDILNFHLPANVFLLMLAASLVIPLVAALIPISLGSKVSIREALSDYNPPKTSKQGLIDRFLLKFESLSRPIILSLRNTFRKKGRLILTLGMLTIAGALFISVINNRSAMMREMDNILALFNFDIQVFTADEYRAASLERRAMTVDGVTAAEASISRGAQRVKTDGTLSSSFELNGINPESEFIAPQTSYGRWIQTTDRNAIVVSKEIIDEDGGFAVGNFIVLDIDSQESQWEVVGEVSLAGGGNRVAYAPFSALSREAGQAGLANSLYVSTTNSDARFQADIANELEDQLSRAGFRVGGSTTSSDIRQTITGQLNFLVAFLLAMAVLVAIVGALGLAGTMSLNVLERTREIGVMRSIGASDGSISWIVIIEAVTIALVSWLLALPLSILVSIGFNYAVGTAFFRKPLELTYDMSGIFIWLAIVVVISILGGLMPAYRAYRLTIRDILAYE